MHCEPGEQLFVLIGRFAKVDMVEELLDVGEVATILKLRPVTIYRWCRAGRLAAVKIGKEWRIPHAAVAALARVEGWEHERGSIDEGGTVIEVSSTATALARRLITHEAAGQTAPAAMTAAALRVRERLRERLAIVIGDTGFATLFDRAQRLGGGEFPAAVPLAPARGTTGTDDSATVTDMLATLATFIGLLGTFIGEDLALRLMRDAWPELADDTFAIPGMEVRT